MEIMERRLQGVGLALAFFSGLLSAQPPVYTLEDCMRYALSHSIDVALSRVDRDDDRIARREAILSAFTPSINASAGLYSNFGRTIDPETNTYRNIASFDNTYGLSAGIRLFNGFEAVNNLRITKTASAMGLSQQRQEEDKVCLAVLQAYCNVLYYSYLHSVLQEQVSTARQALCKARRQEELGQKGHADIVQLEADLAGKDYERVAAFNQMRDARMSLKDVMLYPVEDSLIIDTAAVARACRQELLAGIPPEEAVLVQARNTLAEVEIARAKVSNARYALKTARWQVLPSLSLYGGWSTRYYTYPGRAGYAAPVFGAQFRDNGGEYVQLTLNIPIFDRLSRHSNIARKRNAYRKAAAEYEQKVREVEAEVMRAIQDRDGASAAFLQAERMAEVQQEAYRLNMRKLEQGLISPIEFRTASESYLTAMTERLNTLLQYNIKKAVVSYYDGIPYLEQQL